MTYTWSIRTIILTVAFLGWFFGGIQIGITNLGMRPAALDLMSQAGWTNNLSQEEIDALALSWFAYLQCAFLFGAAVGGYILGKLGDKIGRLSALGVSIVWFSTFTAISGISESPTHLLIFRFLACIGVGGCWPNGVSLVSEAWATIARPIMASLIGLAGNLGIFFLATQAKTQPITQDNWQNILVWGALPALLGPICWLLNKKTLPKHSPEEKVSTDLTTPMNSVFKKPYAGVTLIGIILATVPLFGGWGSFNWMLSWADEIGPPELKAEILSTRSIWSIVGSALAGVFAMAIGRKATYFVASLVALLVAQYAFWFSSPTDSNFLYLIMIWGFFNGIYFGWLPFFLPELFDSKIRSTGAGVSFNFGRIFTASTIFLTGWLKGIFDNQYELIGRTTSLIFLIGLIVIFFAPNTKNKDFLS